MNIIYCFTNPINNRRYIGQTTDETERLKGHIFYSNHPDKSTNELYLDMHNIGFNEFKYEVLEVIKDQPNKAVTDQLLNDRERHYISLYKSNIPEFGYNRSNGGGYSRNKHPLWTRSFKSL